MNWALGDDDDGALLRAALDSLDAWEANGDALCGEVSVVSLVAGDAENFEACGVDTSHTTTDASSSDDGSSPSANGTSSYDKPGSVEKGKTGTRKARVATSTRQLKPSTLASTTHKRQTEIVYLRDKIEDLQQELAALQSKREGESTKDTSEVGRELAVMWQNIATRQQSMRHKAEVEQQRLRRLLEMQVSVSQQLVQAFQTVRCIEDEAELPVTKQQKLILTQMPMCQRERDQLAELETRYRDIHSQFTLPKFNDGTLRFLNIQVTDDSDGSVVIEFLDTTPVPFETSQVLDAMWKDTIRSAQKKWEHTPDAQTEFVHDDDVHVVRFSVIGFTTAEGQFTAKRFHADGDEACTPAIVSISHGTPIPNRDRGIHFKEDVSLRIVPGPSQASTAKASNSTRSYPLSLVQCVRRFRFIFEDLVVVDPGDQERVGFVTNMVLDKLKSDVESKHEVLEMLLMQPRSYS